ncbi:MAG: METTL5 family protein [Candidatus Nanoarchaeia archaeon]|nr:METTL5 family protein [Candidatus Nanoarchaeia archaeon]
MTKKDLKKLLTKLKQIEESKLELEQYQTDPDIVASVVWHAYLSGEIENKQVADLGCGNGIFGIASLILGAKKCFFLDLDKNAIKITKENIKLIEEELGKKFDAEFLNKDISEFKEKVDTILQNPPFGIQSEKHTDRNFLIKAMTSATTIYSIHSADSGDFVNKLAKDHNFTATIFEELNFPVKHTYSFHKHEKSTVKATIWKIESFKR